MRGSGRGGKVGNRAESGISGVSNKEKEKDRRPGSTQSKAGDQGRVVGRHRRARVYPVAARAGQSNAENRSQGLA